MSSSKGFDPSDASQESISPYTYVSTRDDSQENRLVKHLKEITRIGTALSVEKNIHKLLEMIVDEARSLTNADAGTLYILDKENNCLQFQILQSDIMDVRLGGTSGKEVDLPSVPLADDQGNPNHTNVSSHVALTGETISIPDVYDADGFDFSGPREYDKTTGYRSKSMLVIALQNHENEIIGVLQLLNAQNQENGEVISFSPDDIELVVSLASQAAVALTNSQLIQNLTDLFYAFIKSIATAMDEKSPFTGGHINRVVDLTMMIAQLINDTNQTPFENIHFNEDEMEELRLASWMHDIGKITTPEIIVDKATKLHAFIDRIEIIETRFELIAATIENDFLKRKLQLTNAGECNSDAITKLDGEKAQQLELLSKDFDFLRGVNHGNEFLNDEKFHQLNEIAAKTYQYNGSQRSYLNTDELKNLSIRKGTLTHEEREIIEDHAEVTFKMLNELPFPKIYEMVPEYAAGHHEKLDGSGYPRKLKEEQLPLQSRIMAVADIFEALTAKDRPYKKPMKLTQAIKILSLLKEERHIDPNLHDLFVNSDLLKQYARAHMNPDQIDIS
jgi:HD-GYP domain-containing protein (c-di-GMP phosphodiesterase class II)